MSVEEVFNLEPIVDLCVEDVYKLNMDSFTVGPPLVSKKRKVFIDISAGEGNVKGLTHSQLKKLAKFDLQNRMDCIGIDLLNPVNNFCFYFYIIIGCTYFLHLANQKESTTF